MKMELSGAEIAQHDSRKSCWIVIDSKVYDITSFIAQHPGGAAVLLKQAGSVCIKEVKTYSCNERVNSCFWQHRTPQRNSTLFILQHTLKTSLPNVASVFSNQKPEIYWKGPRRKLRLQMRQAKNPRYRTYPHVWQFRILKRMQKLCWATNHGFTHQVLLIQASQWKAT